MSCTNEPIKPRCHAPWQQLMIEASGVVHPCAYRGNYTNFANNPPLGNVNTQTIEEIWNGEEAQKLRRHMAAGNFETAGCANCLAIKQNQTLALEYDADYLNETPPSSTYAINMVKKREEIAEGREILESKPTVLYITPSHRCNLRCTHCYQNLTRSLAIERKDLSDEVTELFPYLADVILGGGEPLILPFWRKLIKDASTLNPYLRFRTATNATVLFPDILKDIAKFKRLHIIVSMDGATPEVFEKIRGAGTFHIVDQNVDRLLNLVKSKKDSWLNINFSVMKDNLLDLPNLIHYCTQKGIGYNLQPVVAYPAFQSLRCFNNVPREMLGWKETIEESLRLLNEQFFYALDTKMIENDQLRVNLKQIYSGHLDALKGLIPFELLQKKFVTVSGRLSGFSNVVMRPNVALLKRLGKLRHQSDNQLILIFNEVINGELAAEPHFYAPLDARGRYQVKLPPGKYAATILIKQSILVAKPEFFITVPVNKTTIMLKHIPKNYAVRFLKSIVKRCLVKLGLYPFNSKMVLQPPK